MTPSGGVRICAPRPRTMVTKVLLKRSPMHFVRQPNIAITQSPFARWHDHVNNYVRIRKVVHRLSTRQYEVNGCQAAHDSCCLAIDVFARYQIRVSHARYCISTAAP
jgi:hypothetical protein